MPSSEEIIDARIQVNNWAIAQKEKEGWPSQCAREYVNALDYDSRIRLAEKFLGRSIYRGAYSAF